MTAPPCLIAWKGDFDPGGRQRPDLRVPLGLRKPLRAQVLARVGRQRLGGLRHIAAGAGSRRAGVYASEDFRQTKLAERDIRILSRAFRATKRHCDRARRAPLVDLRDTLRPIQGNRQPCSRCLVCGARY